MASIRATRKHNFNSIQSFLLSVKNMTVLFLIPAQSRAQGTSDFAASSGAVNVHER